MKMLRRDGLVVLEFPSGASMVKVDTHPFTPITVECMAAEGGAWQKHMRVFGPTVFHRKRRPRSMRGK